MARKAFFKLQYWLKDPPWDTGITPPEVYRFLEQNPPGRALDLGCGTGTNVITLAEAGWQVTGIDFVPRAIRIARRKARRKGVEDRAVFQIGDVLHPGLVEGVFDLVLDIGCVHSFSGRDVVRYAKNVKGWLVPGGSLLLYVHLNLGPGPGHGIQETDLAALGNVLDLVWRKDGEEFSRPSAWMEFVNKSS